MKRQRITAYDQAVEYMMNIPKFTAKNTMEDTRGFLHHLGDPDRDLCILHVAGTNGKGSVCAYLRSVLEAAGKRVAVFTSPHLEDVRERFVTDGEMVSRETFLETFLEVYDSLDWTVLESGGGYHPTFFEYLFFMAMLIFSREKPDYCILETGLGGRLDATNAVARKEIAVITHIGLDHVEYLGNTLGSIAGEKAGIIREGVPVIYADDCPEAGEVIRGRAHYLSADSYPVSKIDYRFLKNSNKNIDFSYISRYYGSVSLSIPTIARYQMENCSLALRALEVLAQRQQAAFGEARLQLTPETMERGVRACFWPGRMEEVLAGVYLDGAHNEDGMRAFLESVAADGHKGSRHLLFAVVRDKDYPAMLRRIIHSGLFDRLSITYLENSRAAAPDALERELAAYPEIRALQYPSVPEALRAILTDRPPHERIYIAGSLYLAGEVKAALH
ncbi:MAG: bifunctional folylpolyglutamate synthase/dihydrofolate synthase [Lachnospiraceae bacterium]|nr:bifunctional folylpolyglutamate synthase/dihydrofolate synthase [Lachnospiraceae bacterium]